MSSTSQHHLAAFLATQNKLFLLVRKFFLIRTDLSDILEAELSLEEQHLDEYQLKFSAEYPQDSSVSSTPPISKSQKSLSQVIDAENLAKFSSGLDHVGRVHNESCSAPGAAAWLTAVATFKNRVAPKLFQVSLRFWLQLPMSSAAASSRPCPICCMPTDRMGRHALLCRRTNNVAHGFWHRHNRVRNLLASLFREAGFTTRRKVSHLYQGPECRECAADVLVQNFKDGFSLVLDVGITNPLQEQFLGISQCTRLDATLSYAAEKRKKYLNKRDKTEFIFKAAIWEVFGGVGDDADFVLRQLTKHLHHERGQAFSVVYRELLQQIGVAIWISNAKMILWGCSFCNPIFFSFFPL